MDEPAKCDEPELPPTDVEIVRPSKRKWEGRLRGHPRADDASGGEM